MTEGDGDAPKVVSLRRERCPVCHRPTSAAFRPFCSRRCANEDLMRWLSGSYRIPGADDDRDDSGADDDGDGGDKDADGGGLGAPSPKGP